MTDTYDDWVRDGGIERDEAMARVAAGSPEYMAGGIDLIRDLEATFRGTGEDIRYRCLAAGLMYRHPNANGSLINVAVRQGLLVPTGEYRHMRTPHNHKRRNPVYQPRLPGMDDPNVDVVTILQAYGGPLFDAAAAEILRLRAANKTLNEIAWRLK
jgi:hypothetical protein